VINKIAEDFTLKDQKGEEFNLYKNLTEKILLIFYPKDNTPVCTRQLIDYQKNKKLFDDLGIILVGINADSEKTHSGFAEKCGLDFRILSDPGKIVCQKYNAVNLIGGIKRKLVLIDTNRKIIFEEEVFSFMYRTSRQLKALLQNL